jgi:hypothetical protein
MTAEHFNARLLELSAMVANDSTDTLFNQEYESMLSEVAEDPDRDRRTIHAQRMRRLADHQCEYLMNQWLQYQRTEGMN